MKNTSRHDTALISQPPRNGPDRGGDAAQPGPGADGGRAVVLGEGRLQDGQAARGQQRPADALQGPGRDQHGRVRGQPAQQRREGEPHGADHEHLRAARSCRRASRRAAAARPASACRRPPPTAGWSRRRGSSARWRAARCRPRSRPGRPCPSRARWRHHPPAPRGRHPQARRVGGRLIGSPGKTGSRRRAPRFVRNQNRIISPNGPWWHLPRPPAGLPGRRAARGRAGAGGQHRTAQDRAKETPIAGSGARRGPGRRARPRRPG
jgi:hypothetical protein